MRSLLRYSILALGLVALLTLAIATFRPALEQTAHAQNVAASVLVISSFRENGPNGTGDEFVEIFNPSATSILVSTLSDDPAGIANGIGVFANAGNGSSDPVTRLVCQIPGAATIPGRGKYLCAGTGYSLGSLGANIAPTDATHIGDRTIGAPTAVLADIPNDAGLALIGIGTNVVSTCTMGSINCNSGFLVTSQPSFRVYDKVGFNPDGPGSPRTPVQPPLSGNYCEGTCLQPIGDASVLTSPDASCPAADPLFPITPSTAVAGIAVCYGESGQYKISRRRATGSGTATSGDSYRDTVNANVFVATPVCAAGAPAICGNADDFVFEAPNPGVNVGSRVTGIGGITSVLGAATPNRTLNNTISGNTVFAGAFFDVGTITSPRNAERAYGQDPTIANTANDPLGTITFRFKFTNPAVGSVSARFRIDDITTLCGPQTAANGSGGLTNGQGSTVATQNARNLRGAVDPALVPTPTCQGEGSDTGVYTAILKAVNSAAIDVVDSTNTTRRVWGSTLEDLSVPSVAPTPLGPLSPLGGGSNNTLAANTTLASSSPSPGLATSVGDGVSGGTGTLTGWSSTKYIQFKLGVVKSGRFKITIQPETSAAPAP